MNSVHHDPRKAHVNVLGSSFPDEVRHTASLPAHSPRAIYRVAASVSSPSQDLDLLYVWGRSKPNLVYRDRIAQANFTSYSLDYTKMTTPPSPSQPSTLPQIALPPRQMQRNRAKRARANKREEQAARIEDDPFSTDTPNVATGRDSGNRRDHHFQTKQTFV